MSFKRSLMIVLALCGFMQSASGQTELDELDEVLLESMEERLAEDHDYSELQEQLSAYLNKPLDLNLASAEQLQAFPFLSPLQINSLLQYRRENGRLIHLQELQAVDHFNAQTISRLVPFVSVGSGSALEGLTTRGLLHKSSHSLMLTYGQVFQQQKGYLPRDTVPPPYAGSPERLLFRYRYQYGQSLAVALTMEKDPGETFFGAGKGGGFDFYSASVLLKGKKHLQKLVLGDYSLQFGQGLSLWTGLSFGKGAAIAAVARQQQGLKPYTSTNEMLFFRGAAGTLALGKLEVTPFVSFRNIDASFHAADSLGKRSVNSLQQSGLHRSGSELAGEASLSQQVFGANLLYSSGSRFKLGGLLYHTRFSEQLARGTSLYKQFDFSGSRLTNGSLYFSFNWKNAYLFAEGAHSLGSGFAYVSGILASLAKELSVVLLYRDYQRGHHSFFQGGFAEGSSVANEKGLYTGLLVSPWPKTEFSLYSDLFSFPWLKYRADAPSKGHDMLAQFAYNPTKKSRMLLRYKLKTKQENDASEQTIRFLEQVEKQNLRLELHYALRSFSFRNRAEWTVYEKAGESEQGFLVYQDLLYKPMKSRWKGNVRFALFNTAGWNSRLYAFENDVLYGYSIPAYYDKGMRVYLNSQYRIGRRTDVWLRYAITAYRDKEEIGSGNDLISGNRKSDVKVQLRFRI